VTFNDLDPFGTEPEYIIIGAHDYRTVRNLGIVKNVRSTWPIMDMVANGTTLIILEQADRWAEQMSQYYHKSVKYSGSEHFGDDGRLFVGKSPLLTDLPINQAMNWEYQVFYQGDVWGLKLSPRGIENIVGIAPQNTDSIHSALVRVPYGTGQINLSTLNILPELKSEKPQSAVAKKLLLNLLEYSR
jgi:hypothetical protein